MTVRAQPDSETTIEADMLIEDLVTRFPKSVQLLMHRDIVCFACGEPAWGTLGEAARRVGLDEAGVLDLVHYLNRTLREPPS